MLAKQIVGALGGKWFGRYGMAPRTASFKQSDVTTAVKGILAAGLSVAAARIEQDGTIVVMTSAKDVLNTSRPDPDDLL